MSTSNDEGKWLDWLVAPKSTLVHVFLILFALPWLVVGAFVLKKVYHKTDSIHTFLLPFSSWFYGWVLVIVSSIVGILDNAHNDELPPDQKKRDTRGLVIAVGFIIGIVCALIYMMWLLIRSMPPDWKL
jgi:uncharacterized BrkB/YihY/UPF0761 family membrane protein